MDYIEKNLVSGETVRYKTRLHWVVLVWPLFAGLFLGGIGLALSIGGYEANAKGNTYSALIIVGVLFVIGASVLVARSAQVPPKGLESTIGTCHPAERHRDATADAADPVPITTRSNCLVMPFSQHSSPTGKIYVPLGGIAPLRQSPSGVRTSRLDVELIAQRLRLAKENYEGRYAKEKE